MIIHLRGGSFENKGDELMLWAVVGRFARSYPDVHLTTSPSIGSYEQRSQLGLYQMLWRPRFSRLSGTLGYLMLKRYGKSFGIVSESDVRAVVDFTGFSYWDPCGTQNNRSPTIVNTPSVRSLAKRCYC